MKSGLKKSILFLLLAALTWIMAVQWHHAPTNVHRYADKLSDLAASFQENAPQLVALPDTSADVLTSTEGDYDQFVWEQGKLKRWTTDAYLPDVSSYTRGKVLFKTEDNYSFFAYLDSSDNRLTLITLPIKFTTPIFNQLLNTHFLLSGYFPSNLNCSIVETASSTPVELDEEILTYVSVGEIPANNEPLWPLILAVSALVLFLIGLHFLAQFISVKYGHLWGFSILVLCLIIFRLSCFLLPNGPIILSQTDLFNPSLFAASSLNGSLGDLLLNVTLIWWISIQLVTKFQIELTAINGWSNRTIFSLQVALGLFFILAIVAIQYLIKSLVFNSVFSTDIGDLLSLNGYSVLALLIVLKAITIPVLVYLKFLPLFKNDETPLIKKPSFWLVIGCLFTLTLLLNLSWWLAIWTVLAFFVLDFTFTTDGKSFKINRLLFVIAYVILMPAYLFSAYNVENNEDRMRYYAQRVLKSTDYVAEYALKSVIQDFELNQFIVPYFNDELNNDFTLNELITQLYFGGYLSKYKCEIDVVREEYPTDIIESRDFSAMGLQQTSVEHLYQVTNIELTTNYIVAFPVSEGNRFIGTLLLTLDQKTINQGNAYPDILLETPNSEQDDISELNYAVYYDGLLARSNGKFQYDGSLTEPQRAQSVFTFNDYEHVVHNVNPNLQVLVSWPSKPWLIEISFFSVLLLVGILYVLGCLFLFVFDLKTLFSGPNSIFKRQLTFKNRITFSMIGLLLASFVLVGVVTNFHFRSQHTEYHKNRLLRKTKALIANVESYLTDELIAESICNAQGQLVQNFISGNLTQIANIHNSDINIYNIDGQLIYSSIPGVFQKRLKSEMLNPKAFQQLTAGDQRVVQYETIGDLDYLASYSPLYDKFRNKTAYLQVPYYSNMRNLDSEISSFLIGLVNTYIFLLLGGGLIAFLISNSLTRSLTQIKNQLRTVAVGGKNQRLEWANDDEIGALIDEYNRMLRELDRSAAVLAFSERENAWREMARQIAHEIKNPLTPMQLSIQYMQRAIQDDDADVKSLVQRMSGMMLEQIDNLASIATNFSLFARMTNTENEPLNLVQLLDGIVNLFKEDPTVQLRFEHTVNEAQIFADKNQMVSAYNNLIKNAIQAIEENPEGKVEVNLSLDENRFKVTVKDNGVGIPDELSDKIFTPNFTTKNSGSGLGLAITKQIFENANGSIWFESETGVGTTFITIIPIFETEDED